MLSVALQDLLERLNALRQSQVGLPIASHRVGIGRLIVAGKKLARFTTQPMINELLRKQTLFNEEVTVLLRTLILDLKSLEDGTLAAQEELTERVRRVEANLERLVPSRSRDGAPVIRE